MAQFSSTQNINIEHGAEKRKRLAMTVQRVIKRPKHTYFFTEPGYGKTFTIEQELKAAQSEWVPIKGNTSLWGFIVDLAQIVAFKDPGSMFIFIDDCDNLLLHQDSINTLKIALADNKLVYNKSLSAQYAQLEETQQDAIDTFRREGRNGVEIPLDDITFIWASNYKLADQGDYTEKTTANQKQRMIHEEALRRRMHVLDVVMDKNISWGWIADCVLNSTPPSMMNATVEEKMICLDWLWAMWDSVKEHNISFVEKLYDEMVVDPDTYKTAWELDYTI